MNCINAENLKEIDRRVSFKKFLKFGFIPSLRHVNSPALRLFCPFLKTCAYNKTSAIPKTNTSKIHVL